MTEREWTLDKREKIIDDLYNNHNVRFDNIKENMALIKKVMPSILTSEDIKLTKVPKLFNPTNRQEEIDKHKSKLVKFYKTRAFYNKLMQHRQDMKKYTGKMVQNNYEELNAVREYIKRYDYRLGHSVKMFTDD
jgi:hypothetical protein